MEPVILFPCNSTAKEAIACLSPIYRCIGFVDDDPLKQGQDFMGIRVYSRALFSERPSVRVLAVPGGPSTYLDKPRQIAELDFPPNRFVSVIHPAAQIADFTSIGINVLVMAGVVISALATIGNHVCILPNTVIHHDCVVGDYAFIGANCTLAGAVTLEKNVFIGSGTSIIQQVTVGERALVGLGSVVIRDVKQQTVVAGNPAKPLIQSKS